MSLAGNWIILIGILSRILSSKTTLHEATNAAYKSSKSATKIALLHTLFILLIERGDSTPSAEFMLRISKYFNMLVEDVFHVED